MTQYEAGDTVEVTFRGVVVENYAVGQGIWVNNNRIRLDPFKNLVKVIEKVKKPVYVNSDTTEFQPGDVWTVEVEDDASTAYVRGDGLHVFIETDKYDAARDEPNVIPNPQTWPKRKVLLVRDGKPVTR